MSKSPVSKVILTQPKLSDKKLELLQFVGEGGAATFLQLQRRFWPEATSLTTRRELHNLCTSGFLVLSYTNFKECRVPVYSLSREAMKLFSPFQRQRMMYLPKKNELTQQLLLQQGRILLEEQLLKKGARIIEWRNEHVLRSLEYKRQLEMGQVFTGIQLKAIPDAGVTIQEANGHCKEILLEADGAYFGATLNYKLETIRHSPHLWLWVTFPGKRAMRLGQLLKPLPNVNLMVPF